MNCSFLLSQSDCLTDQQSSSPEAEQPNQAQEVIVEMIVAGFDLGEIDTWVLDVVAGFDLGEVESESPRLRSGCGGCCTPGTTAAAPDPTTNGSDNHRNGKDQTGSQKF